MGSEGINFAGVTVLLSIDSEGTCVQARKDIIRYIRRNRGMSKREIQCLQKQREGEDAVYPQCADISNHTSYL